MRIFVAGASGAIGQQLLPRLIEGGHDLVGMASKPQSVAAIERHGARAVVADGLDPDAVASAVAEAEPEVIVHQMTALSGGFDLRRFERTFALTNRLRSEGSDYLLSAARATGARRFVAQSYAGWPYARSGGPVKTEADPLDPNPPRPFVTTLNAIKHLEDAVAEASGIEGVVLRYGGLYGPGTSFGPGGEQTEAIRARKFPIVGSGGGMISMIHVADAAAATVAAIEGRATGLFNVVDDDPTAERDWLPAAAVALGAKRPRRVPKWLARVAAGEAAVVLMTESRGASNAKAKRDLDWQPSFSSWRQGLAEGLE